KDVLIDEDWSFVRGGSALLDEPISHFPSLALAALSFAVVGLGAARGALEEIRQLASRKKSITGAPQLGDRSYAQTGVAKAEVQLQAARAFLCEQVECAWEKLVAGQSVDIEAKALLRLAANHASRAAVDVTQACFAIAGT